MNFETNKIVAAVLTALLLALGLRVLAEGVYETHAPEEPAYHIEVASAEGAAAEEAAAPVDFRTLIATGNPAIGERLTARCKACHTFEKDGPNRTGPNLYGVVGRAQGGHPGFGYSTAMQNAGGVWDYEHLFGFLENSSAYLPGTAMNQRVRKPEDRANLIAYLRCNSDAPPPLPEVEGVAPTAQCP